MRALAALVSQPRLSGESQFGLMKAPDSAPPSDATNYLGGVGDVLEAKTRRGVLEHLGDLTQVALYENDRQIQGVHYHYERGEPARYTGRIWPLE